MTLNRVVLGLGSNLPGAHGDRMTFLRQAIQILKSPFHSPWLRILKVSPIYESDALLPEGAPEHWNRPFLNLCLLCESSLSPLEILEKVKLIEAKMGRKQRDRWAPREIDIDLLAIDSHVIQHESLKVPHPGLLERPFAFLPLADLLPHWRIPQPGPFYGMSAAEYISQWKEKASGQIPFRTHRTTLVLTELMGILNITPDSFSDGGKYYSPQDAVLQIGRLIEQGAHILDLGAESTRPGATPLSGEEEWKRLSPLFNCIEETLANSAERLNIRKPLLSIDTRHAEVAKKAIESGADWINDVSGLEDPAMQKVVADSSVDLVFMHSLTLPADRTVHLAQDKNPVSALLQWGENRIQELIQKGIERDRLIFDPGIGFGKTIAQTWEILRELPRFQELGVRILVGHSRKSFLSSLTTRPPQERDLETGVLSLELARLGVNYLRVHDIESTARCLKAGSQISGIESYDL